MPSSGPNGSSCPHLRIETWNIVQKHGAWFNMFHPFSKSDGLSRAQLSLLLGDVVESKLSKASYRL